MLSPLFRSPEINPSSSADQIMHSLHGSTSLFFRQWRGSQVRLDNFEVGEQLLRLLIFHTGVDNHIIS